MQVSSTLGLRVHPNDFSTAAGMLCRFGSARLERSRFKCCHLEFMRGGIFFRKMPLSASVSVKSKIETAVTPRSMMALLKTASRTNSRRFSSALGITCRFMTSFHLSISRTNWRIHFHDHAPIGCQSWRSTVRDCQDDMGNTGTVARRGFSCRL